MAADAGDSGPPDLSDRYNTPLTPDDEARYQSWGQQQAAQRGDGRNPAADTYDYDMRGFWRSGEPFAANGHAGDTYKKPNHPTFSNQSRYHGADGFQGGAWGGGNGQPWRFTPSDTNLQMHGAGRLQHYFEDQERGNQLILPQPSTAGFGSWRGGAIRRDAGGYVPMTQTLANMNPIAQGQEQRYAQMTEEQLQELALRAKGSPQGAIVQRMLQQKRLMPQPQAADPAAGPPQTYALGGMLEAKGGVRLPERAVSAGATPPSAAGFLHTAGPGRTDNLHIQPHADSYVIPADVTSGLGQGNSLAGAKALDLALKSAPYGASMPTATHAGHRMGPPHMGFGRAAGGSTQRKVPIVAAGGEFVVTPEQVRAIGHGDIRRGHDILDAFVLHVRKRTIAEMKKLKGPVKS